MKGRRVGSLLGAAILLGTFGVGTAHAAPPATAADDAATQAMTTQATVDRAKAIAKDLCDTATASAAAAAADPNNVAKQTQAASDAAACASAQANADSESSSLSGVNGGVSTEGTVDPALPADVHNTANNAVKSDNISWVSNSRGLPSSVTAAAGSLGGNDAGANFIHYENLGYDFLFGDGTGGLSIWSLKDPEHPTLVGGVDANALRQPAGHVGNRDVAADSTGRFYEGENPTVDPRRKLMFLARDPRSFDNRAHPGGRTGMYIIDVKNPWAPKILSYHWVPAGHTQTCINDCRYLWTVGPANNGSNVTGQPQDVAGVLHPEWTGVPTFVTDVRDPLHPYTYANPVDMKRNNNTTAYTHSVDVDQDGRVWTSGFGGVRGYYTNGMHHDIVTGQDRYATATDPVPYAGGGVPSLEKCGSAQTTTCTGDGYAVDSLEHNSYHVTQAADDHTPTTVTTAAGRTLNKTDLQYITQENTVACTSTTGGGSGRFMVASLAGSYDGKAWTGNWDAKDPTKRYFLEKLGDYTPYGKPGDNPSANCSAHWFSVLGDDVAIAFYGQGTRVLDVSDPTNIQQAAYIRIPAVGSGSTATQPANNSSAAYWHNGYIYVADYARGVDVLRYSDPIKGHVQPLVCWNSCSASQTTSKTTSVTTGAGTGGDTGGSVPATLSLSVGAPATFGNFTPGSTKTYTASTTANVISTAGDALLSVADPSATATGHLVNGTFSLPQPLQAQCS